MLSAFLRRPRAFFTATLLVSSTAVAVSGCAASPVVRAAEAGQFEGLRDTLAADVQSGRLSRGDAIGFARAIARGEIERAKGEEGAQRLRDMTICARAIDDELDKRAGTRDALGAVAALMRLDAGSASAGSFSRWADSPADAPTAAWRALGARSLTSSSDGELRRKMIADPDEEVRRSALVAAMSANEPEDIEAVLEAARVDPSPAARAQAIRAAGAIGGERAVLALRDIWQRADETVRAAIVDAWATRNSFTSGGRRELGWVVDRHHGKYAVAAAVTLVRAGGDGSVGALGALERAIKEGPTAVREHAIELSPFSIPVLRDAMQKAEADSDEAVATAAMIRRFEADGTDAKARAELAEKLLKVADGNGPGWLGAIGALARARDTRVVASLEREGAAKDVKTRVQAGTAMAMVGDLPRAAVIAADAEPRVRVMVACAILNNAK